MVDTGVFMLMNRVVFHQPAVEPDALLTAISTTVGFLFGLLVNYILSITFVFVSADQKTRGRDVKSMLIFTAVSVIGWGLTVLLVWLFSRIMMDLLARIIAAGIVMVWNYLGRKILIFK